MLTVIFTLVKRFTPFAVHLKKTDIHFCPNLFHYGEYTLINANMTFVCAEGTFKNNICICVDIQNHSKKNNTTFDIH